MNPLARMAAKASSIDLPVLTLEMRRSQRGTRPFVLMFFYVLALAVVLVVMLRFADETAGLLATGAAGSSKAGQVAFVILGVVQLGMISLLIPALTAGALTSEKERGTIDMLALTSLGSMTIVNQKLAAAVAQAGMLVVASLPVIAVVFLLGGVSPLEVVLLFGLLMLTAAFYGCVGILSSALFSSTRTATLMAYVFALFVMPMCGGNLPITAAVGLLAAPLLGVPMFSVWVGIGAGAISILVIWGLQYLSARQLESMRRAK